MVQWLDRIPLRLTIVLLGAVLFIPFLGNVHLFDWDEINFAESAREMLETGNFLQVQINYEPFSEKPPFFIWMQAISMKIFGVNEFAARLPNAITGILTLLFLFKIGTQLKDRAFGVMWVMVYLASFLPHLYFKSGIIDPMFNLFIFLGLYNASKLSENDEFLNFKARKRIRKKAAFFSGLCIGLAVLTKGPVGLLLFGLAYALVFAIKKFQRLNTIAELFIFAFTFLATVSVWYVTDYIVHGDAFVKGFIQRQLEMLTTQDAGHGGPFYYHFIVLLLGCFPASVFMFGGIKNHDFSSGLLQNFQRWMLALLIVVLLVFSIVQTKIIHYSSLTYFPITFFAAYFLYYLLKGKRKWRWYHATLLLTIGIVWGSAIMLTPLLGVNIEALKEYINDDFAVANLDAIVYWSNKEAFYGLAYIAALVSASILFSLKHKRVALSLMIISTCMIIQVVMTLFVPRIEKYTQNAAIEFYKSKQGEECYVEVLNFKSYAHLFYTKKLPNLKFYTKEQLLNEDVEFPVYFVCKNIHEETIFNKYSNLEKIGEKNGFVFLRKSTN
jgi:4-amino-4-deoxy-L-arabinose transferase-like glycosyltransferase